MNSTNPSQFQTNPTETASSGGSVSTAKQRIKVSARETVDQVKQAATSTLNRAKEETGRLASDQKRAAAEKIGGYSSAIHDSAKSLEEKDPNIAWFTHRAADRLQGVADYVRDRDFNDLRRDAENVVRRHPVAFFGGLFLAGVVVGNLLKASGGVSGSQTSGRFQEGIASTENENETSDIGLASEGDSGFGETGTDVSRASGGSENQVTT